MPVLSSTAAVNAAIATAKSLPNLIANLYALDPALATQLESKTLLASKTPWGTLTAGVVAWVSSRYMRALTKQPIAGVLTSPLPEPAPQSQAKTA